MPDSLGGQQPTGSEAATPSTRSPEGVELRPLLTRAELEACVALQKEVWGEEFADVTSPALLKVVQAIGGVAAGAFRRSDGRLEGFIFGVSGVLDGRPTHWSHMLAVREEHRGKGLGVRLKWFQRDLLLAVGVETVFWTFDPLVARNAHLNLVRLGASIDRYERDYYGEGGDSTLSAGLGTDRLVVRWELRSERTERALAGEAPGEGAAASAGPVLNVRPAPGGGTEPALPGAAAGDAPWAAEPAVQVEIPAFIIAVRDHDATRAKAWRAASRAAFEACFEHGYRVETLVRVPPGSPGAEDHEKRCRYVLVRGER